MDRGDEMGEKLETEAARLAAIDRDTLAPPVQSALGSKGVEVVDWEFEQLHGGIGAGTAVYRFAGVGRDLGRTVPWSLILKTLRGGGAGGDGRSWDYRRREVDAYRSGWLAALPGGLAAPRCFGVTDQPDGSPWMWLEEVVDEIGPQWPLEHYGVVARHVGRFNGAYLVGRPLPEWSWLSSDWFRQYVAHSAPAIEPLRDCRERRWARRFLPEEDADEFFRLWAERELYLGALDRLPRTICHFDLFSRNLFARKTAGDDDETVVIDWAYVGPGPIGADANPLVWFSAVAEFGTDKIEELEEIVLAGYLQGLREVGWQGDPRQVRLGYTAAGLRYVFGEIDRWLALILDESLHAEAEQMFGQPVGELFDYVAATRPLFMRKVGEARELMGILR